VLAGRAQCVLGNHELNVMLGEPKHGNGWFFDRNHELANGEFLHSRAATPERRAAWSTFLCALPVALEREDLRVVHAAGRRGAHRTARAARRRCGLREVHAEFDGRARRMLRDSGIAARAAREVQAHRHDFKRREASLPMLPACAEEATLRQNANPLKVIVSGLEAPSERPLWAGGRWRMTSRARWWNAYRDGAA